MFWPQGHLLISKHSDWYIKKQPISVVVVVIVVVFKA